jgi:hypothetical protein
VTAVIGWRFAYVIRTTYKWWVEVCANGKQEVATGCFHRWSGHELTPLHRPISLFLPLSLFSLSLSFSLTRISLFLSFYLFLPPSFSRVFAFPSSTISPSLRLFLLYSSVAIPSSCSCLEKPYLSLSLCPKLAPADPWHVMLDV